MTEDLHNDIDDLFRSGLEGKEDMPSPDVWAGISRGLPSTPPPSPATTSTPPAPAVGEGSSTIILKGLIGTAIVAVLGTAVYFMTDREHKAAGPDVPLNSTESVAIQQQPKTSETTGDLTHEGETDRISLPPQASDNGTKAPDQASTATENAEPTLPDTGTPDQRPESERGATVKEEVLQTNAGRPMIPEARTLKNSTLSEVKKGSVQAGNDPSSALNIPGKSFERPTSASDINRTSAPVERLLKPNSVTSKVTATQAEIVIDRRNKTSNMKAVYAFRIPNTTPAIGSTVPAMPAPLIPAAAAAQKGSAPLKRNDWRSRIYLTPMMSLNMTTMEVEENRSFGPRIGREHIEFRETEDTKTTLSPGLIAGYAFTPRISVQSGVSELRNDINVSPKPIRAVRDRDGKVRYRMDCSSGSYFLEPKAGTSPSVGDSLRIVSSDIKMRYVSIPLSLRVNFGSEKVRFFATAGADVNILAKKQTTTTFAGSSSDKISPVRSEGTRKQYLNGTLGAGVEIKAGKRLGIMLMPQYRFPLGNMNEEGPVLTYPKTFSISSGIRIGF